jgi:tetratricopeptide (TPR) repeat protein
VILAGAALSAWLAALPQAGAAAADGDCSNDAAGLVSAARDLLGRAGRAPASDTLERARQLFRRARLLAPGPALSLSAADLAAAAGDFEEAGDLLSEAAESGPGLLSLADRFVLAARAEARGRWNEAISQYESLREAPAGQEPGMAAWLTARLARLRLEAEAQAIAAPPSSPPPEARLALADGKRALVAGRLAESRTKLKVALEIAPGYVEALLALGAVESRDGRAPDAIRAYRAALKAEPERFEALVALANVLWDEPSRTAKEESLALLDRATASRPDLPALLHLSANRWAEWGDAPRALALLDAFRERATEKERRGSDALREALLRRVRGQPEEATPVAGVPAAPAEPPSAAVEQWRKAQVYVQRGDPSSLEAALKHLAEAERLDPRFARAPELTAAIYEKRGQWSEAERALARAISADPSRASSYEWLARLLARDPRRAGEAEAMWRRADEAGSPEAAFALAELAESAGRRRQAAAFLRRYRSQSPGGVHADEAARALDRLERTVRLESIGLGAVLAVALCSGAFAAYRRRAGRTFREWLALDPAYATLARPIVGRLRHEALKHGGLLLSDAAARLAGGDAAARQSAASLLCARLYGDAAQRSGGLVAESFAAIRELEVIARDGGVRLNLRHRDPVFSRIVRALAILRSARPDLARLAASGGAPARVVARAAGRLELAAEGLNLSPGAELERILDEASALPVDPRALEALLLLVAEEEDVAAPVLEPLGEPAGKLAVRVAPGDWETIWRNLFANALTAGRRRPEPVRLALSVEARRDPVTGERRLRIVLSDDAPGPLTTEMIRGRAADRGWGVVADLVRRHDGLVDVGPPPAAGFAKSVVLDFPAVEA